MPQQAGADSSRSDRRKARTRAALVRAAQSFIAAGNPNAPILEITRAADVGMGSFYNHFQSREELLRAAFADTFETYGAELDRMAAYLDDPAEAFTQSFRITGRLHRKEPETSRVILANGLSLVESESGLAPRLLRDIERAAAAGRFTVADPVLTLTIVGGAALFLGNLLHAHPDRDDAESTDQVAEDLLRMLGMAPQEAHELARRPLPDLGEGLRGLGTGS